MYTMNILYRGTYSLGEFFEFTLPWVGPFKSHYVVYIPTGISDNVIPCSLGCLTFESILTRFTAAWSEDPEFVLDQLNTTKDCIVYNICFPSCGDDFGYIKFERCNDEKS